MAQYHYAFGFIRTTLTAPPVKPAQAHALPVGGGRHTAPVLLAHR